MRSQIRFQYTFLLMAFGFGAGAAGGDPYAPNNSKIFKLLEGTGKSIDLKKATDTKKDQVKDQKEVANNTSKKQKYALPEEKKKFFYDVKMDGVNFSKIIQKQ